MRVMILAFLKKCILTFSERVFILGESEYSIQNTGGGETKQEIGRGYQAVKMNWELHLE